MGGGGTFFGNISGNTELFKGCIFRGFVDVPVKAVLDSQSIKTHLVRMCSSSFIVIYLFQISRQNGLNHVSVYILL